MNNGTITLNKESINNLRSDNGGFTKAVIETLGLKWKDISESGWAERLLCGKIIPKEQYDTAYSNRNVLLKNKNHVPTKITYVTFITYPHCGKSFSN